MSKYIDKEQLLSDIDNLTMPLGISSKGVDATYMDGYLAGKKQRESEIIDIINKQRVAELEKPKKKRKFRAMTNSEFCRKWWKSHLYCKSDDIYCCPQFMSKICYKANQNKPCKINGKYIMVEVKE